MLASDFVIAAETKARPGRLVSECEKSRLRARGSRLGCTRA